MLLFLTESREFGIRMAQELLSRGILPLQARPDAGIALCDARDTCGAVLDGRTDTLTAERLCEHLLAKYPEMPIAMLLPRGTVTGACAARLIRETQEQSVLQEIQRFCRECCGWKPELTTYTLSVGASPEQTCYLGYRLPLSPRQLSILRFLFLRAPKPVASFELLSVCFPECTQRDANLAVQISRINQTAARCAGVPLIESVYGFGYRLRSGIVPSSSARADTDGYTAKHKSFMYQKKKSIIAFHANLSKHNL